MQLAFEYVKEHGLCTEEDYPYHAVDEECKEDKCKSAISIKGYQQVPSCNGIALKKAVSKNPVSVAIDASTAYFQLYESGVLDDSVACGTTITHGVLVVGYTADYWIVKNSWSEKWGEKGYFRVAFTESGVGICGINAMEHYPVF